MNDNAENHAEYNEENLEEDYEDYVKRNVRENYPVKFETKIDSQNPDVNTNDPKTQNEAIGIKNSGIKSGLREKEEPRKHEDANVLARKICEKNKRIIRTNKNTASANKRPPDKENSGKSEGKKKKYPDLFQFIKEKEKEMDFEEKKGKSNEKEKKKKYSRIPAESEVSSTAIKKDANMEKPQVANLTHALIAMQKNPGYSLTSKIIDQPVPTSAFNLPPKSAFTPPKQKSYKIKIPLPKSNKAFGVGEEVTRIMMKKMFGSAFPKRNDLDWLRNRRNGETGHLMELDGFNDKIGVAFEYQGEQHYQIVKNYEMDEESLAQRKADDKRKYDLCARNGIILLQIPYWIEFEELPEFITKEYYREYRKMFNSVGSDSAKNTENTEKTQKSHTLNRYELFKYVRPGKIREVSNKQRIDAIIKGKTEVKTNFAKYGQKIADSIFTNGPMTTEQILEESKIKLTYGNMVHLLREMTQLTEITYFEFGQKYQKLFFIKELQDHQINYIKFHILSQIHQQIANITQNLQMPELVNDEAIDLINKAMEFDLIWNSNPQFIAGTGVYLACLNQNLKFSQETISNSFNSSTFPISYLANKFNDFLDLGLIEYQTEEEIFRDAKNLLDEIQIKNHGVFPQEIIQNAKNIVKLYEPFENRTTLTFNCKSDTIAAGAFFTSCVMNSFECYQKEAGKLFGNVNDGQVNTWYQKFKELPIVKENFKQQTIKNIHKLAKEFSIEKQTLKTAYEFTEILKNKNKIIYGRTIHQADKIAAGAVVYAAAISNNQPISYDEIAHYLQIAESGLRARIKTVFEAVDMEESHILQAHIEHLFAEIWDSFNQYADQFASEFDEPFFDTCRDIIKLGKKEGVFDSMAINNLKVDNIVAGVFYSASRIHDLRYTQKQLTQKFGLKLYLKVGKWKDRIKLIPKYTKILEQKGVNTKSVHHDYYNILKQNGPKNVDEFLKILKEKITPGAFQKRLSAIIKTGRIPDLRSLRMSKWIIDPNTKKIKSIPIKMMYYLEGQRVTDNIGFTYVYPDGTIISSKILKQVKSRIKSYYRDNRKYPQLIKFKDGTSYNIDKQSAKAAIFPEFCLLENMLKLKLSIPDIAKNFGKSIREIQDMIDILPNI